jgi:TRAP-type mannitol/chloroaromatic compound transport system substrate-binding protein
VQLHDSPDDYFTEFMAATKKLLEENAEENEFFKKVYESQKAFAKDAVPYWAQAQRTNANLAGEYAKQLKNE